MLGGYKNSDGNSSSGKTPTAALAEIKEGAERLAKELDEYLKKSSSSISFNFGNPSNPSGEAVADLQLATARKLREVCFRFRLETSAIISLPAGFSLSHQIYPLSSLLFSPFVSYDFIFQLVSSVVTVK
jgi:hypothetical protein